MRRELLTALRLGPEGAVTDALSAGWYGSIRCTGPLLPPWAELSGFRPPTLSTGLDGACWAGGRLLGWRAPVPAWWRRLGPPRRAKRGQRGVPGLQVLCVCVSGGGGAGASTAGLWAGEWLGGL